MLHRACDEQSMRSLQGLESAQWEEALRATAEALGRVKGNEISFIAGKLADAESLIAAKVGGPPGRMTFPKACLACMQRQRGHLSSSTVACLPLGSPSCAYVANVTPLAHGTTVLSCSLVAGVASANYCISLPPLTCTRRVLADATAGASNRVGCPSLKWSWAQEC